MEWHVCCRDCFAQGSPRLTRPKVLLLLFYILFVLFFAQGFLLPSDEKKPGVDAETVLATENFRRIDSDVSPAVCEVSNRVSSPDPTPVGCNSSAAQLQLFVHRILRVFPLELECAPSPFLLLGS